MNNDFTKKTARTIPYLFLVLTCIMVILLLAVSLSTFKQTKQEKQFLKEFYSGDYQQYIDSYNSLDELNRVEETFLYLYGISNFQLKHYGKSIESFELFHILYPESSKDLPLSYYLLGISYFKNNMYEMAKEKLLLAESYGYLNNRIYLYLGLISGESTDLYTTKEYLEKAGLDSRRIAYFLLNKYIAQGKYVEAELQFELLIHQAVTEQELYKLYLRKADIFPQESIQLLKELSQYIKTPELLQDIYRELAVLYEQQGNLIEARTMRENSQNLAD